MISNLRLTPVSDDEYKFLFHNAKDWVDVQRFLGKRFSLGTNGTHQTDSLFAHYEINLIGRPMPMASQVVKYVDACLRLDGHKVEVIGAYSRGRALSLEMRVLLP